MASSRLREPREGGVKMGLVRAAGLAAVVAAAVVPAQAKESVARTVEKLGLMGRWASDCGAPASDSNWHTLYSRRSDGKVSRKYFNGPEPFNDYTVTSAEVTGDRISYKIVGTDKSRLKFSVVLSVSGGKLQVLESRDDTNGEQKVKDGKFTANGQPSPIQTKCGK